MKMIRKIILALLILFLICLIGGYFYFDARITPPKSTLNISNSSSTVPITWFSDENSPMAALLLPVTLKGIPDTLYMQFDTGCPSTLFYKNELDSLRENYSDLIPKSSDSSMTISQEFSLGNTEISSEKFKVIEYESDDSEFIDPNITIIGTLGTDLVENKFVMLNFKRNLFYLGLKLPEMAKNPTFSEMDFDKRKVLLKGKLLEKQFKFLFDTGTSGYQLITDKKMWNRLAEEDGKIKTQKANSWGNILITNTIDCKATIDFNKTKVKLNEVTYISGIPYFQKFLMQLTGLGGLIGNKIFQDKIVILDFQQNRYSIVD